MNGTNTFLLLSSMLLVLGCQSNKTKERAKIAPSVRTEKVQTSISRSDKTYSGTIEETSGSILSFSVSGTIERINVSEGQRVAKGQLIATVSETTLRNSYEISAATLKQTEDAYRRMKQLHENGSLPEMQWVEIQSKLEQAQAAERISNKQLRDCKLYAPFGGVVAEKTAEAGQNVAPCSPVIKLVTTNAVKVKISVPENEISRINVGMAIDVSVPALENREFRGRISEKGIIANAMTRSYEVKATIDNAGGELLPGMVCDVAVAANDNAERIIVPATIIQIDGDNKTFVWTCRGGVTHRRMVTTGGTTDEGVIITAGLSTDDEVIVEGQQKVSEGMNVTVLK